MSEQNSQPSLFGRIVQAFLPALLFTIFAALGGIDLITNPFTALLWWGLVLIIRGLVFMFIIAPNANYNNRYAQAYSSICFGTFLLLPWIHALYEKLNMLNYSPLTLWVTAGIHALLGLYVFIKSRDEDNIK